MRCNIYTVYDTPEEDWDKILMFDTLDSGSQALSVVLAIHSIITMTIQHYKCFVLCKDAISIRGKSDVQFLKKNYVCCNVYWNAWVISFSYLSVL